MFTMNSRICGSKTRNGCTTCKARHLKCDESRPACQRCTKSGRQCGGYAAIKPRRAANKFILVTYASAQVPILPPKPDMDALELRSLGYFQSRVATELMGSFCPDLWTKHMLILAENQACIKHALIAFSNTHESFTSSQILQDWSYADKHYGKAIQGVVALENSNSQNPIEIALAACIIFALIESMRGHYKSSLEHLDSGLKIIQQEQRNGNKARTSCLPIDLLYLLFWRMDSQMMDIGGIEFSRKKILTSKNIPPLQETFSSPEHAMLSLEAIYNLTMHFLSRIDETGLASDQPCPSASALLAERERFRWMHYAWELSFRRMLNRTEMEEREKVEKEDAALLALKLTDSALKLMLGASLIKPELDFDRFIHVFREIVKDTEAFVAIEAKTGQILSMTAGVVMPLYFTAARCRDSAIRHSALDLLRKCRRREGLWDSELAFNIASKLITVEEAQALTNMNTPDRNMDGMQSYNSTDIPENMRIKTVNLSFGPGTSGGATYSTEYPVVVSNKDSCFDSANYSSITQW